MYLTFFFETLFHVAQAGTKPPKLSRMSFNFCFSCSLPVLGLEATCLVNLFSLLLHDYINVTFCYQFFLLNVSFVQERTENNHTWLECAAPRTNYQILISFHICFTGTNYLFPHLHFFLSTVIFLGKDTCISAFLFFCSLRVCIYGYVCVHIRIAFVVQLFSSLTYVQVYVNINLVFHVIFFVLYAIKYHNLIYLLGKVTLTALIYHARSCLSQP